MNIKRYLVGTGLALSILGGVASFAIAEESTDKKNMFSESQHPRPVVVQIGPSGNALLRGTIKTIGTDSLIVTSWGGDWTVNVSSSDSRITIIPKVGLDQFKTGDFVGVQGSVNQSASFTIDARLVRNWSGRKEIQENKQDIRELIKQGTPRNWQGTASDVNVSAKTFTLTVEGVAYSVNLTASAIIVNQKYATIAFSDIKNGDTVRVWGPLSGTTITASVVRDVSIK